MEVLTVQNKSGDGEEWSGGRRKNPEIWCLHVKSTTLCAKSSLVNAVCEDLT